ncbi:carbohydrate-binding module family 18 protein [Penicillium longicatenatum]|uniref:carbohydrate-binding module family 18 protein n=1 Tax=Penicillium longicatenatum TaxID=1561947 RepID=UPI0025481787|nr:carbohydrate-binding module family 18 protein [Penicillium longicatenatum]KAJ5631936.1 carbohydrate-binding module family 18 protein [Penicillium longicatenatum]
MWRQRLMSPLLPNGEQTDYLLKQYEAIQSNCSTSFPVTTYGTTLSVATATATVSKSTALVTSSTSSASATSTSCLGQLIQPFDEYRSCFNISDTYNVSTGAIVAATGDQGCEFHSPICLPFPCEIDVVWDHPSCQDLATRYSTESNNITLTQFMAWNPTILGSCGFVSHVQRVCKSPPGRQFTATAVVYAPTAAGSYYSTATPAEPTQAGTTSDCGLFYDVVSGDTCNSEEV